MKNIIEEILTQLIEEAFESKANATSEFKTGILFGYYASISKILNQAEAFGIFDKLPENLQKFKPENLLDGIK